MKMSLLGLSICLFPWAAMFVSPLSNNVAMTLMLIGSAVCLIAVIRSKMVHKWNMA